MSRANPGLHADAAATEAMRAQVLEAKLNWLPQGTLLSLLAPSPKAGVLQHLGRPQREPVRQHHLAGGQPEHALVEPRLHPHRGAADSAGVGLREDLGRHRRRQGRRRALGAEGGRLARRSRSQHPQGLLRAQAGARGARHAGRGRAATSTTRQKKIEKDLAKGTGSSTVTDKLRLQDGARRYRRAPARDQASCRGWRASSLRALVGPDSPADIDVDDDPFEPPDVADRPVTYYEDLARAQRPEVKMLEYAGQGQARAGRSRAPQGVPRPRPHRRRGVRAGARGRQPHQRVLQPLLQQHGGRGRGRAAHAARPRAQDRAQQAAGGRGGADRLPAERGDGRHHARGAQGLRRGERGTAARRQHGEGARRPARPGSRRWRRTSRSGWPRRATFRTRWSPSSGCGRATCRRSTTSTSRSRRWRARPASPTSAASESPRALTRRSRALISGCDDEMILTGAARLSRCGVWGQVIGNSEKFRPDEKVLRTIGRSRNRQSRHTARGAESPPFPFYSGGVGRFAPFGPPRPRLAPRGEATLRSLH